MYKKGILAVIFLLMTTVISGPTYRASAAQTRDDISGFELIIDAPWYVTTLETPIPIIIHINHASQSRPIMLNGVRIWQIGHINPFSEIPINRLIDTSPYVYIIEDLTPSAFNIEHLYDRVDIQVEASIVTSYGEEKIYKKRLQIFMGGELPSISGWHPGDTHYHSEFTDNPLEWGYGLFFGNDTEAKPFLSMAGRAMGLEWTTVTDHSCDFGDDLIIESASGGEEGQWLEMANWCTLANNREGRFLVLPAEEVTHLEYGDVLLGSEHSHILAYSTNRYIDGPEVPFPISDHWGGLRPLEYIADSIESANVSSFWYIAHPMMTEDPTGIFFPKWDTLGLIRAVGINSFAGLELWNTRKTKNEVDIADQQNIDPFTWKPLKEAKRYKELSDGLIAWDDLLCRNLEPMRKIFIEGGSDAHGDFNYSVRKKILGDLALGIFSTELRASDNAFGKVRTYVYSEDGVNEASVYDALKNGHSVVTDGPLLVLGIDKNLDGNLRRSDGDIISGDDYPLVIENHPRLFLQWATNGSYPDSQDGKIDELVFVTGGPFGVVKERVNLSVYSLDDSLTWNPLFPASPMTYYYRAEAIIRNASGEVVSKAYTNPIWVHWKLTAPEIRILAGNQNVSNGSQIDLGSINLGSSNTITITIENAGSEVLLLGGNPYVRINPNGEDAISVTSQPISPLNPLESTYFTITFEPRSEGTKAAQLVLISNDPDENPFVISLVGVGLPSPINSAPLAPMLPSGPFLLGTGELTLYDTSAVDPDGDTLTFRYDWGDGTFSEWGNSQQSHSWNETGYFLIRAQARDSHDAESLWSIGRTIRVSSSLTSPIWPMFGSDSRNTSQSTNQGPDAGNILWRSENLGLWGKLSPTISSDGTIYALSGTTGSPNRSFLNAISPNGIIKWKYLIEGSLNTSQTPTISPNGDIYISARFVSGEERLIAINREGDFLWSVVLAQYIDPSLSTFGAPALDNEGTIYVNTADWKLYAIRPDGSVKWVSWFGGGPNSPPPLIARDGAVLVVSQNILASIDPLTGFPKWTYSPGSQIVGAATIDSAGQVYFSTNDGRLIALISSGTIKWTTSLSKGEFPHNRISSPLGIRDDMTIYISHGDGYLIAVNAQDGSISWEVQAQYTTSAAIDRYGTIYFGANNYIFAFDHTGLKRWEIYLYYPEKYPSISSSKHLYIGARGIIYAIGEVSY